MEIVIENEPMLPTPPPPPALFHQHPHRPYSSSGFYHYATLPRGGAARQAAQEPPAPATSLRRIDKSGLLEEPLPRRTDRSGLLEAVPELPDQQAGTDHQLRTILGSEGVELTRRSSFGGIDEACQTSRSGHRVQFAPTAVVVDALKNESTIVTDPSIFEEERLRRSPMTLSSNVPDVIEAHNQSSGSSSSTMTTMSTSTGTMSSGPEGERAEAEGCEHVARDSPEESRMSAYKSEAKGKVAHGDNIHQSVHVIILSEQL